MTLVRGARLSLAAFGCTLISSGFILLGIKLVWDLPRSGVGLDIYTCVIASFLGCTLMNVLHWMNGAMDLVPVGIRASFLAVVFFNGMCISYFSNTNLSIFGWYMCVLSFFHFSEYFTIAITNPKTLTTDAFMLNHSLAYNTAACASWLEFFLEYYFYPDLKNNFYISIVGLMICVGGEIVRKLSMFTASTNFNHIVQTVKQRDHVLVTHGIYSAFRHPSYVGWFYWSIGTQIILVNPICIVVYAIASWLFFKNRILLEEETLFDFFGIEYIKYKFNVPSGLPFIRGLPISD